MERLTAQMHKDLAESYNSIYSNSAKDLQEEQHIQEFLQTIDELVQEGYDLSEYTYDDLYEYYISEGGFGSFLGRVGQDLFKAGKGTLKTLWRGTGTQTKKGYKHIPGAKQTTKEILARTGRVAPVVGAIGATDHFFGGNLRRAIGSGIEKLRQIGHGNASQTARPSSPSSQNIQLPAGYRMVNGKVEKVQENAIIKKYLLDEGYASTEDSANVIANHMSENWKQNILGNIL